MLRRRGPSRRGWLLPGLWLAATGASGCSSCGSAADQLAPSPWSSEMGCELSEPLERGPDTARIATWNVRWFPDGTYLDRPADARGTNVDWTACAIAHMNVDVVAVQEFKKHARADAAAGELLRGLNERTGGRWQLVLDDCPHENQPHVGFLFDASRVEAGAFRAIAPINPHDDPCAAALRPGWAGRFRFAGGLDVELVVVHAKSGTTPDDHRQRSEAFDALGAAYAEASAALGERDVVFLGDFNTNGCSSCAPPLSAAQEIEDLAKRLAMLEPPLRLLRSDTGCTEYEHGRPWPLDHLLVPADMAEASGSVAHVAGFCAEARCRRGVRLPAAHAVISDHCPVLATFDDRDADSEPAPWSRAPRLQLTGGER